MKFTIHEIKLWFYSEKTPTKSYYFLPNKINVITGNATTGKTSFWSIIDYCLLANKINIVNAISEKVSWFGIKFTINDKEISIVRKSPKKGTASSEVYFSYDGFPKNPTSNTGISDIKAILDDKFGITDDLRFPFGKELGDTTFNLSYRYFLLFNALTESIIGAPETYFDTTFYGKEEYENALSHIFDLVIGVNDMDKIKALERLEIINEELKKIQRKEKRNQNIKDAFKSNIYGLIEKCKKNELIEYNETINNLDNAIGIIEKVLSKTKKVANNSKIFKQIDELNKNKLRIKTQLTAINRYKREYSTYKKNLKKSAESLQPIEFLRDKLSDQLIDSYDTKIFIRSLEDSLIDIKKNLNKKDMKPIQVSGNIAELNLELKNIESQIKELNEINKNYKSEGEIFIVLGEIKYAYEQILLQNKIKPIDVKLLNELNEEKERLNEIPKNNEIIKYQMKRMLDSSIQRNYNQLTSLPEYKNSTTTFNDIEMILQLQPEGELFPIKNIGSKSNYMFLHLCFYLGMHEHMISIEQHHVPQFLFIDQPSIPYYSGTENDGNDDRIKLLDAFSLLNSFLDYIIKDKKNDFQIFMVEHANKEYWKDLSNFHTVDEFINGKGLIPQNIYNN